MLDTSYQMIFPMLRLQFLSLMNDLKVGIVLQMQRATLALKRVRPTDMQGIPS